LELTAAQLQVTWMRPSSGSGARRVSSAKSGLTFAIDSRPALGCMKFRASGSTRGRPVFGPKARRSAGVKAMGAYKHFDPWSFAVIGITLTLFLFALVSKGFTHDLLLEAGVFLVSVKLILLGYKLSASNESILQNLEDIHSLLKAAAVVAPGAERIDPT
jgi:hypothetical protein